MKNDQNPVEGRGASPRPAKRKPARWTSRAGSKGLGTMQDNCCTKAGGDVQARGRCDADCDETAARATPKQDRPADPLDFRRPHSSRVGTTPL